MDDPTTALAGRRVVLGVSGGIAAYKAALVARALITAGATVDVVMTDGARSFVGPATFEGLTGRPVRTEVWEDIPGETHVALARAADVVVVFPATAHLLAKAAAGLADDLLTTSLLAATCPVVLAPAMHTEMWQHPATQANVRTLRERGAIVLDPDDGRLTGADSGPGRLPDPALIADMVRELVRVSHRSDGSRTSLDLVGTKMLISAGGTQEPWDDVRYLGNRSSGRQGFALARTALARGASVTLVVGHTDDSIPPGCSVITIDTAEDLRVAMHDAIAQEDPDVVVMAAAVADFRPVASSRSKITKESLDGATPELTLEQTTDVLAEIVAKRGSAPRPVVVGFAAEAPSDGETLATRAQAKLARKGCDYLVANEVSGGAVFGEASTSILILSPEGERANLTGVSKADAADAVWDIITADR